MVSDELLEALRISKLCTLERRMDTIRKLDPEVSGWRKQADEGGPLALLQSQIDALLAFLVNLRNILEDNWKDLAEKTDLRILLRNQGRCKILFRQLLMFGGFIKNALTIAPVWIKKPNALWKPRMR